MAAANPTRGGPLQGGRAAEASFRGTTVIGVLVLCGVGSLLLLSAGRLLLLLAGYLRDDVVAFRIEWLLANVRDPVDAALPGGSGPSIARPNQWQNS